jgi:hypothetical protein
MESPNLNYIDELSGDDLEFRESFIKILKDEFPVEKQQYLHYIEGGDFEEASQMVHKLKHKMNILSLVESYKTAVIFEEKLRLGNEELRPEFMKIMSTIENYLKTI